MGIKWLTALLYYTYITLYNELWAHLLYLYTTLRMQTPFFCHLHYRMYLASATVSVGRCCSETLLS